KENEKKKMIWKSEWMTKAVVKWNRKKILLISNSC
ncbi:MAG: hypothetical protein ACI92C_002060, partial [Neolewinella sp.]